MWRFLNHNLKLQPEFYDFFNQIGILYRYPILNFYLKICLQLYSRFIFFLHVLLELTYDTIPMQ